MVLMEPTGSSNTAAACVAKRGVLENECVADALRLVVVFDVYDFKF